MWRKLCGVDWFQAFASFMEMNYELQKKLTNSRGHHSIIAQNMSVNCICHALLDNERAEARQSVVEQTYFWEKIELPSSALYEISF